MEQENEDLQLNQEEEDTELKEEAEETPAGPKISSIEFFIWPLPAAVLSDLVDLLQLTGVGVIISWAVNILCGGSLTLWLFMKGLRGEFMLLGSVIDMIPVVGSLPTKTTIMIWIYVQQKHPEKLKMAAKGLEVAGKVKPELAAAGKALEAANNMTSQKNEESQ
ncbi:MAG: hypothetical protein N2692_00960 [Patescibacteria group bacterium]|jgi:hypothetical protein|nr:hypothetical protein [Patescibacteria group bacterium]